MAHQEPFLRQPVPKDETKWQREQRAARESQVWERSVRALGSPPEGIQWIHVGDRASDMFPFLSGLCGIRCATLSCGPPPDRCVDLVVEQADTPVGTTLPSQSHATHPGARHLFEVAGSWPLQGARDLALEATKTSKARTAHLAISYGVVASAAALRPQARRPASHRGGRRARVGAGATRGRGTAALAVADLGARALPVEQAWERVDWYRRPLAGRRSVIRVSKPAVASRGGSCRTMTALRTLLGLLAPVVRALVATARRCQAGARTARPARSCLLTWWRWSPIWIRREPSRP